MVGQRRGLSRILTALIIRVDIVLALLQSHGKGTSQDNAVERHEQAGRQRVPTDQTNTFPPAGTRRFAEIGHALNGSQGKQQRRDIQTGSQSGAVAETRAESGSDERASGGAEG
jgi:hypothetical protein